VTRLRLAQASNTKDIVVKKMVYLFLCNYAAANAELTLLAINTLQKDWCVAASLHRCRVSRVRVSLPRSAAGVVSRAAATKTR
jgi:vesicle coat complex subunit